MFRQRLSHESKACATMLINIMISNSLWLFGGGSRCFSTKKGESSLQSSNNNQTTIHNSFGKCRVLLNAVFKTTFLETTVYSQAHRAFQVVAGSVITNALAASRVPT